MLIGPAEPTREKWVSDLSVDANECCAYGERGLEVIVTLNSLCQEESGQDIAASVAFAAPVHYRRYTCPTTSLPSGYDSR